MGILSVTWEVDKGIFDDLRPFSGTKGPPEGPRGSPTVLNRKTSMPWEVEIKYRLTGWIGTVEVNRDMRLKPGEKQRQNVSPGSSPASRFTSTVPIHPVWLGNIYLSRHTQPCLNILLHPLKNFWRNHLLRELFGMLKWQNISKFWNNHSKTV